MNATGKHGQLTLSEVTKKNRECLKALYFSVHEWKLSAIVLNWLKAYSQGGGQSNTISNKEPVPEQRGAGDGLHSCTSLCLSRPTWLREMGARRLTDLYRKSLRQGAQEAADSSVDFTR